MGAGISKKALYGRIYNSLKRIQRELETAGVVTKYRGQQLYSGDDAHGGFNISIRVIRASNGECAGINTVYIPASGERVKDETYCFNGANGDFKQGIARVKQIFVKATVVDDTLDCQGVCKDCGNGTSQHA